MTTILATADSDLGTFISTITSALKDFTTGNLATVLVAALGITAALAIAWFAYKFIVRKTSKAMKKGGL